MLVFEHVDFYHKKNAPILKDIHFTIQDGEFVSIVGKNGCGKSTLAKLMIGLLLPKNGIVRFHHLETSNAVDLKEIRQQIGFIFQNPEDQFITTSVRDEIIFGLENIRLPKEEMDQRVHWASKAVDMGTYLDYMPHELSGGQKQRVAIAAILAMRPQCIIFDEATSMLDPIGREQVLALMQSLHQSGLTIIHITHHMDEVMQTDRVLLLDNGQICFDGRPITLFETINVRDFSLVEPMSVRIHQLANEAWSLTADWEGAIRLLWDTNLKT
ncbi:ATP-binding cassette domain-containing protein [Lysinibacillus sp. NPDC093210]|uniref:ATP-binding cassette domain-containing protein n=1 Tax=Lysinibacillus sp. NPDC093210 TaxID=3364133 RepID=UPI0037FD76D7